MSVANLLGVIAAGIHLGQGYNATNAASLGIDFYTPIDESSFANEIVVQDLPSYVKSSKKFGAGSYLYDPAVSTARNCIMVENPANFNFGTGDFTVEMWVNSAVEPATGALAGTYGNSGSRGWQVYYNASSNQFQLNISNNGTAVVTGYFDLDTDGVSPAAFWDGNWHHVAAVRSGADVKVYVDGLVGSGVGNMGANGVYVPAGISAAFGAYANAASSATGQFEAGMDEIRVSKRARYSANFTPPAAAFGRNVGADPYFADVLFLVGFDAQFSAVQFGSVSTGFVRPGSSNVSFDKYGSRVTSTILIPAVPNSAHIEFGSGDFTIEVFGVRNTAATAWGSTLRTIIGNWYNTNGNRAWRIIYQASGTFAFQYSVDGTNIVTVNIPGTPVPDVDYNIMVVRQGATLYLYLNGTLANTHAISTNSLFVAGMPLGIGGSRNASASQDPMVPASRIRAARINKGLARFTGSTYTVPTMPLPT